MIVKVSAFDIDITSKAIGLNYLINNLVKNTGQMLDNDRTFYFDKKSFPGYCVGVIITVKDQKSFCTLADGDDGSKVIRVNGLNENNKIMDFNFFAINLINGIGIYQHYHQSAPLSSLEQILKIQARLLKDNMVEQALELERQKQQKELSAHKATAIKRAHTTYLKIGMIVRPETLKKQLEEYAKIKGMEYTYTVLEPNVRDATPLGNRVLKKKETITFNNSGIVGTLSKEISAAVKKFGMSKGKVFVEDANGIDKTIKIFNMPEVLWEETYDNVVAMIDDINPDDFGNNAYLRSLVKIFSSPDYKSILMATL